MTFWKSLSFKALQAEWYQRLEKAGFQDAERLTGAEMVLKQRASHPYKGIPEFERDIKQAYFAILAQRLHETAFKDEIDKLIMTWHAEGHTVKMICEDLDNLGEPRNRNTIRYMIRRYEMAWGMRSYPRSKLNLW